MIILLCYYDDLIIIKGPGRGEEVRQWLQEHKEVSAFICDADDETDDDADVDAGDHDHNEHDHDQEVR